MHQLDCTFDDIFSHSEGFFSFWISRLKVSWCLWDSVGLSLSQPSPSWTSSVLLTVGPQRSLTLYLWFLLLPPSRTSSFFLSLPTWFCPTGWPFRRLNANLHSSPIQGRNFLVQFTLFSAIKGVIFWCTEETVECVSLRRWLKVFPPALSSEALHWVLLCRPLLAVMIW